MPGLVGKHARIMAGVSKSAAPVMPMPPGLLSAGAGGLVGMAAAVVFWPIGWAEGLVLLAALVLVPLALDLPGVLRPGRLRAAVRWTALPAGSALLAAFVLPPGWLAAALALPWLTFTTLVAAASLARMRTHRPAHRADGIITLALLYLPVGGLWAVSNRAGYGPLGFQEPIVLLTAAHWHYAGFLLVLLAGLATHRLGDRGSRRTATAAATGVPLVAVGITLTPLGFPLVEWLSAWWMAAAGLLLAGLHFRLAARAAASPGPVGLLTAFLFAISGAALMIGMALAALYGLRAYWQIELVDIPFMLPYHGAVNALGFTLPALAAWTLPALRIQGNDRALGSVGTVV
jgi:hypothetical protein